MPHRCLRLLSLLIGLYAASCRAPQGEIPEYSRDIATVGNYRVKEDLLRFRFRLALNNFPKKYVEQHRKEPLDANNPLKPVLDDVFNKILEDDAILAYGDKHKIVIPEEELKKRFETKQNAMSRKELESVLAGGDVPYARWKKLAEDQIRVQYVLEKSLGDKLKVSAAEVQNYYSRNRNEFKVAETVRVRHIVTDTKEKAEALFKRIQAGENFAQLAVNHSISPDRARGGDLGYYGKATMPVAFDEAFKLKKGQVSPIIKSEYGFHIFKLIDRKPPGIKTLNEVAPSIGEKIFEQKLKSHYGPWIGKVKKEIPASLDEEALKNFVL